MTGGSAHGRAVRKRCAAWQPKHEATARLRRAAYSEISAHGTRQVPADRQAEPGTGTSDVRAKTDERLKDRFLLWLRDSWAVVEHFDEHRAIADDAGNVYVPAARCELDGVAGEIHEDLAEPLGVCAHPDFLAGGRQGDSH